MSSSTRRVFLQGLGGGMVAAGLSSVPGAWSVAPLVGGGARDALEFGSLEPLVDLIQTTGPDRLQELLVERLRGGTELKTLVAAGALANARAFGGHDYTGYHCMMALAPAFEMSKRLPAERKPLPVLKVLYRTAARIQQTGRHAEDALHQLTEPTGLDRGQGLTDLRAALLAADVARAEAAFVGLSMGSPRDAFEALQSILREDVNVHRNVLAWRSWETLELTGEAHARTLMRQCVRFCVDEERDRQKRGRPEPPLRTLLPELVAEHGLEGGATGTRRATDRELSALANEIFVSDRAVAAGSMAAALASGLSLDDAGEAVSLAANSLLLHDPGRKSAQTSEKPKGSVHGASVGVHAADAARAWRNIASVSSPRDAAANLIAAAFHAAGQSSYVGDVPVSYETQLESLRAEDSDGLAQRMRAAVEGGDQLAACAVAHRWSELRLPEPPLLDLLLEFAVSQDGALHAEKYYRTICEELAASRASFRKLHLIALARVTASEHGWTAPGYDAARELLGA